MKIVFYYESIALGGQQSQTFNIIRELSRLGHEITWVYCYGNAFLNQIEAIAKAVQLKTSLRKGEYRRRPWRLIPLLIDLHRALVNSQADCVISGSGIGAYLTGIIGRSLGIPNFWLIGGRLDQVHPTLQKYFGLIRFDSCVSGYFGWPGVFEQLVCAGATEEKFVDLPNAVDTEHFRPSKQADRLRMRVSLNIPLDAMVIGWVGRVAIGMQVWATLDLFQRLASAGRADVYLLVLGGGPDLELMKQQTHLSQYGKRVVFTDWVPYEEVPRYIGAMDVVPLLEEDPQGGSIMRETMACGRVALSVDGISGTQRRFMVIGSSMLVPSNDYMISAMNWLMPLRTDCEEFKKLGFAAREYAQRNMSFARQCNLILKAIHSKIIN